MEAEPVQARPRRWTRRRQVLVAGLLLASLSMWMNPQIPHRMATLGHPAKQLIYLVEILAALVALAGCAIARRRWAVVGALFFSANFLVGTTFFRIKGRGLTLVDGKTLLESVGSTQDALAEFWAPALFVTLQILAVVAVLIWARLAIRVRSNLPMMGAGLVTGVLYVAILVAGGDTALNGFPTQFQTGLHTATLSIDTVVRRYMRSGPGAAALTRVPPEPGVRHIVLVIDESVEGAMFRGLVDRAHLSNLRNLGLGYSFANSSAASNLMIRRGADPSDAGPSLRHFPSLFQLAKEAGFKTFYIDCQGVLNDLSIQDYFDDFEKSFIDEILPAKALGSRPERDLNAIDGLLGQLGKSDRTFTLVNKVGTHFPYANCLPPELAGVQDPYPVSVTRTSLGFLEGVAGRLPKGTLLFYTSDHGQNFQAKTAHGNLPGECGISEWTVPVILLSSSDLAGTLRRIDPRWQDHASHALLTESIRNLLGKQVPGMPSLWSSPRPEDVTTHRAFYGSPMGLFGKPISYLTIDMNKRVLLSQAETPAGP